MCVCVCVCVCVWGGAYLPVIHGDVCCMFGVPDAHLHYHGDHLKPGISLNTDKEKRGRHLHKDLLWSY